MKNQSCIISVIFKVWVCLSLAVCLVACVSHQKLTTNINLPAEIKINAENLGAAERSSVISGLEIQALLDAWLESQNAGDFEAYEKTYASQFYGIKRSGLKTYHYNRPNWLKDRRRMFQKKMVVAASSVRIVAKKHTAEVHFIQKWSSGAYQDRGPKRLFIIQESGLLKIAQEEMLRSDLIKKSSDASPLDFAFMVTAGKDHYLLLDIPKGVKLGKPELLENLQMVVTKASVDEQSLPKSIQQLKGMNVRIGGHCVASVSDFDVISRVLPHFGFKAEYQGSRVLSGEKQSAALHERNAEIASMMFYEQSLGLKLQLDHASCNPGKLWGYGRLASLPEMVKGQRLNDLEIKYLARNAFTELPRVLQLQREFAELNQDQNQLWYSKSALVIDVFKHPNTKQVFVSAFYENNNRCGGFGGSNWAVWRVHSAAKSYSLELISSGMHAEKLIEAVDLDADGFFEFIIEAGFGSETLLYRPKKGVLKKAGVLNQDCSC